MLAAALAIEGSGSMSDVQDQVRNLAAPLGYDRFVLFSVAAMRDEEAVDRILWIEGDWFGTGQAVDALTYVRRCPMSRHVLEVSEPFFWSKTKETQGEAYRIVATPRGKGIHGLQVPIFGPSGLEGAMSFGGEKIHASPQTRVALSLVGTMAFRAASRLLVSASSHKLKALSDREREILAWTGAGRRQADIAAILGLSERTVENHLRRIRKRLGVATTAQAVLVAIRNGIMEV